MSGRQVLSLMVMVLLMLLPVSEQSSIREERSSIPGAVLTRQDVVLPGLQGNPNPKCEPPAGQGFDCPEGWTGYTDDDGKVCLKVVDRLMTWDEASQHCQNDGGNLVTIPTRVRQATVDKAAKTLPNNTVWIGLLKNAGSWYFSWPDDFGVSYQLGDNLDNEQTYYLKCVYQNKKQRVWSSTTSCASVPRQFICDKTPDGCQPGRFGEHCEEESHCHGTHSDREGKCDYGCQSGWMGPLCCAKREPADVAHYCMNSEEEGRYLLLRVDPKNVAYDILTPVDVARQPLPWCDSVEMDRDIDGSYTYKIPAEPPCAGEQTGNNSYSWRISLQEKEGLRLPLDRTVLLTCDFDNAETLSRGEMFSFLETTKEEAEDHLPPVETLKATKEDLVLEVIDPYTGAAIQRAQLGKNVALRMRLNVSKETEVTAQGVSPYSCQASTLDGQFIRPVTDRHGCSVRNSTVSQLTGSNGTVTSEPFQLFAFPGYQDMNIACAFQFCFGTSQQSVCDDRCAQGNHSRQKRNADEKPKIISTRIHIQSDADSRSDHAMVSQSAAARMMTPVTWLFIAVLLVVSGVLV